MSNEFQLEAEPRNISGKADARRLRHQQRIPAIIYGGDQDPQSIVIEQKNITKLLNNPASYAHILTLNVGGKSEKVILKALQRHAYKPLIQHADFLRIKAKEAITMNTPLHFLNEESCAALKQGGLLSKLANDVEIKCLPADLPESIDIDLSSMVMDQTLHLSDITLPKGVELTQDVTEEHNPAIASIHMPKAAEAIEDTAPTASETEVSGDDNAENTEAEKE